MPGVGDGVVRFHALQPAVPVKPSDLSRPKGQSLERSLSSGRHSEMGTAPASLAAV